MLDTPVSRTRVASRLAAMLLALLLCWIPCRGADRFPLVRAIEFSGNEVTRPQTMRRELLIRVGQPADPGLIERSRQAVQNLGLFKSVTVQVQPLADGVRLLFTVREKWRVLPLPKINGNSGGEYGYGGQLRWNNLWGLNQTLELQAMEHSYREPGRSSDRTLQAAYTAPFVDDSRFGWSGSAALSDQQSMDWRGQPYRESIQSAELLGHYALSAVNPSKGWNVAAGINWLRDAPSGDHAPGPSSYAAGPVISVTYDNLQYLIFSEEGQRFRATTQAALDGLASTYTFSSLRLGYRRDWHLGDTPHQTLELIGRGGLYSGGAPGRQRDFFAVGGTRSLRGYSSDILQGDAGYYAGLAYLRPVGRDWCRLLVVLESGSAYPDAAHIGGRPQLLSLGVGLRIRINWLIDTEVELGAAVPLVDGHGVRPFAGSGGQDP